MRTNTKYCIYAILFLTFWLPTSVFADTNIDFENCGYESTTNCSNQDLVFVDTELGTLSASGGTVAISFNSTNASCGLDNGSATALGSVSGSSAGITYLWNTGASFQTINDLSPGTYTVIATALNGCTGTASIVITLISNGVEISATTTPATCTANNGTATASVINSTSGGSAGVSYVWNNGGMSPSISGLSAGTYSVMVTDLNGCTGSGSATVGQNVVLLGVSTSSTAESCAGNDGTASALVSGATGTVTYLWSTGDMTANISGLSAGNYTVNVSDENGCLGSANVTVGSDVITLNVSANATDATCNASDGAASASVSNGQAPFIYAWSNGANSPSISGLLPNIYTINVTDANGCVGSTMTTVDQNNVPLNVNTSATDETCTAMDGTATASVINSTSGGSAGVSYVWNNGGMSPSISGLSAGTYSVMATDLNGCTGSGSATVGQNVVLLGVSTSSTAESCAGNDGTASALVSGATGAVTYLWSTGDMTANISGLSAGNYTVNVSDENGCVGSATVTVGSDFITLNVATNTTDATCDGSDGTASATTANGQAPFTYVWSNGQTTANISGLPAGTYTVTATDANGCSGIGLATVGQNIVALNVSVTTTEESCNGNDGTATASVSGGTGTLTYLWSTGDMIASISGLLAGNYTVTVIDANGCEGIGTGEVTSEGNCDPYCPSSGQSTQYEWIDNVEVNNIDNQSGDNGGYANFTNIVFQGSSGNNNITLTPSFSGNSYREYWRVWIDFNQDGDFNDSGELVLQRNSFNAFNDYFYIPSTALSGQTRMRVSMKYGGYAHPCDVFAEGEVEDYTIDISVCDNVTDGGEIEANETLCPDNDDPAEMTSVILPSGGSGALEYVWLMNTQTSNPPPAAGWTVIPNSDAPTYDPGSISQTTWYIRCARRNGCTEYLGESNVIEKTFNSSCNPGDYCESYGESTEYEWIRKVRIQYGFNNVSGDDGGYGDYTNLSVDLYPGEYPWLQLRPGYSSSSYYEYWRIWVDWNNDGDFDDAGELENQTAGFGTRWTSIGVPYNAANGSYRMRVSMKYGGYPDPCEVFAEGEVEDYTINIIGSQNAITSGANNSVPATSSMESVRESIQMNVYPNPVVNNLNVSYEIPEDGNVQLEVLDVTGKLVLRNEFENQYSGMHKTTINVGELAKGAYFIRILNGEHMKVVKFFKQ